MKNLFRFKTKKNEYFCTIQGHVDKELFIFLTYINTIDQFIFKILYLYIMNIQFSLNKLTLTMHKLYV